MQIRNRHQVAAARRLGRDSRGLAAIEFALIAGFLSIAVLNIADVSTFLYDKMQVQYATEMGGQAVAANCTYQQLPVVTNCTNWSSYVTTAVQSTELGTSVALQSGSPTEGYYCVNSSGALQFMNATSQAKPANCAAAGTPSNTAGDWVEVQTTYSYSPIFGAITLAALLPTTITGTSFMRLG